MPMEQQQNQEIERKFLVKTPPTGYEHFRSARIIQGYLTEQHTATEIRIRHKGNRYVQTVKRGQGLVREEIEIDLSREQFDALWPLTEGRRLEKVRYFIPHGNLEIELDVYQGNLAPLMTAEVEFRSVEESNQFTPLPWMEREVTEELHYGNVNLAMGGIPEGFKV